MHSFMSLFSFDPSKTLFVGVEQEAMDHLENDSISIELLLQSAIHLRMLTGLISIDMQSRKVLILIHANAGHLSESQNTEP